MNLSFYNIIEVFFCLSVIVLPFCAIFQKKNVRVMIKKIRLFIRHTFFFPHRIYLFVICTLSIVLIVFSFFTEDSPWLSTVSLSSALSILAGIVVAVYSEFKNIEVEHQKRLSESLDSFADKVNCLADKIDSQKCSIGEAAIEYLKLIEIRNHINIQENYYDWGLTALRGPIPSLGDSEDDIVSEIIDRIEEAGKRKYTKKESESLLGSIRDSLAVMQRQNRLCQLHIKEEMQAVSKIL